MLKSKFYEINNQKALMILTDLPSELKMKIFDTKISQVKSIFPPINIALVKGKIEEQQKSVKSNIKNINLGIIGMKSDKMEFKEDKQKKKENFIKEIYISELSSSSLNISTDYLSSLREKKFSLHQNREKSRFRFADSSKEVNHVPETILKIISRKTSTYFRLRNIDINIDTIFSKDQKEWENLQMLNTEAPEHN